MNRNDDHALNWDNEPGYGSTPPYERKACACEGNIMVPSCAECDAVRAVRKAQQERMNGLRDTVRP